MLVICYQHASQSTHTHTMKNTNQRESLYQYGISILEDNSSEVQKLLKSHIFNLQTSDDFIIKEKKDVAELVSVLNSLNHK